MKLILVLATVARVQAERLDRIDYLHPKISPSVGHGNLLQTPQRTSNGAHAQTHLSAPAAHTSDAKKAYSGTEAHPKRVQAAAEKKDAILRQDNSNDGETYSYAYETENGIFALEKGVAINGVQAQGSYSYTGDDGKICFFNENGFMPQGDHLPTPHPIPKAILKALEQDAKDEAAGIYDDGSYNEVKYSGKSQQQYYSTNAKPINYTTKSATVGKEDLLPPRQRNLRTNAN